jgi:hypothetical protein
VIMPAIVCGCETSPEVLGEDSRFCLAVGCRGMCLGLRMRRSQGTGEKCVMKSLMICTAY